jgi:hypothetical protein
VPEQQQRLEAAPGRLPEHVPPLVADLDDLPRPQREVALGRALADLAGTSTGARSAACAMSRRRRDSRSADS